MVMLSSPLQAQCKGNMDVTCKFPIFFRVMISFHAGIELSAILNLSLLIIILLSIFHCSKQNKFVHFYLPRYKGE